ncbi:serine hydrolase [Candidatus Sumerlaeota bacterium]|nr:serine hydrolase [Candidatus Sumerlaeota bacterium]
MRVPVALLLICIAVQGSHAQLTLRPDVEIPALPAFRPLPPMDLALTAELRTIVEAADLNVMTPADQNPDGVDEWSSICLVDLRDLADPRLASWQARNLVYPASTYKLYVMGEAIRQVCEGEMTLDDVFVVEEHNVRGGSRLTAGQQVTLSEVLRLMMQYSDNTAANVAIDIVDRQRASALLRAMGCFGSDITRKYLSRSLEDEGYADVPGTESSALHFATFLWAAETGAIGGGRGRGLIRGYLSMVETGTERMRAGLPDSATLMSKTGTWDTFSSECGIIEDGETRYILCVMTALPSDVANPRIADLTRRVHALMSE